MHDSSRLYMKHEQNRRKNVLFIKDWGGGGNLFWSTCIYMPLIEK